MQYAKLFSSDYDSLSMDYKLNRFLKQNPEYKVVSMSYCTYVNGGTRERLMVVFEKDDGNLGEK